jgi:hypothetical protein
MPDKSPSVTQSTRQALSPADQALLLDSLDKMGEYIAQGVSPTEALAKVAEENKLGPSFMRVLGYTYNAGAVNEQRLGANSVLEKFATIPLADPEKAIEILYSKRDPALDKKSEEILASSYRGIWSLPTYEKIVLQKAAEKVTIPMEKKAEAAPPLVSDAERQAKKLAQLEIEYRNARTEFAAEEKAFFDSLSKLASELELAIGAGRTTYDDFREAMSGRWQKVGEAIAALTKSLVTIDFAKHASAARRRKPQIIDWKRDSLWKEAECCCERARRMHAAKQKALKLREMLDKAKNACSMSGSSRKSAPRKKTSPVLRTEKRSSAWNLLIPPVTWAMIRGTPPEDKAKQRQQSLSELLNSPLHNLKLQRIQWQALLHDMMTDDVIGSYEPAHIAKAFREIVNAAPQAAKQPALLRALMRRRLAQGMLDTYEALETARIDALASKNSPYLASYLDATEGDQADASLR